MKIACILFAALLLLGMFPAGCSKGTSERVPATESSDPQKPIRQDQVVGSWEFARLGIAGSQNYFDDGTCRWDLPAGDSATGTWTIDKNILFVAIEDAGETATLEIEIVRIDELEMVQVGSDDDGARLENTWVRQKK